MKDKTLITRVCLRTHNITNTINYESKRYFQNIQNPIQTMEKYVLTNIKHDNQTQEHEICKTRILMESYFDNIYKHEYKMRQIGLWFKIVLHTGVKGTKRNGRSYAHYTRNLFQNLFS